MSGARYTPSRDAAPRRSPLFLATLAALAFGATGAVAQAPAADPAGQDEEDLRPSRFSGAISLLNTQPLGDLETGAGFGGAASAAVALDPRQRIRVRADLRFALYGHDRQRSCLGGTAGCLIQMDIDTNYSSFYLGFGPELALPLGNATVVLDATAGLGRFAVDSSVRGVSDQDESLFDTNNFHDEVFAWAAGGELRVPLSRQVGLSFGAHYLRNGEASYVPEGGIGQLPDGSLDLQTLTTDANQVAITLGVAFHPTVGWLRNASDD